VDGLSPSESWRHIERLWLWGTPPLENYAAMADLFRWPIWKIQEANVKVAFSEHVHF